MNIRDVPVGVESDAGLELASVIRCDLCFGDARLSTGLRRQFKRRYPRLRPAAPGSMNFDV